MGIPYARTYTATVQGSAIKTVACEHCQTQFVYALTRVTEGAGTSFLFLDNEGASDRASAQAERNLDQILKEEFDLVPCPGCFRYQANMFARKRSEYYGWLKGMGLVLLLIGALGLAVAFAAGMSIHGAPAAVIYGSLLAGIVLIILGLVSFALQRWLSSGYDPNQEDRLEERKQIAEERAMLRADFETMVAERMRDEEAALKNEQH